jgi:pimeloyl-ACP methyl ester carboxylesterase
VHGNPDHSEDWLAFMERLERPAIAFDLPGFGNSARPASRRFDYTMHGLAHFFGRALGVLGVDRYALVVHDWGGLALIDARRHPERLERLAIINAVPLLPGYRWHWLARYFWRVPLAGELFNLTATKPAFTLLSRRSNARPGPMPPEFVDMMWRGWRRGLGRPVLRLYRSGDPDALAAAGVGLGDLDCPALVLWGMRDPYIPGRFARAYAERLARAELVELEDAGHWPWIDRPDVVDRVVGFLE